MAEKFSGTQAAADIRHGGGKTRTAGDAASDPPQGKHALRPTSIRHGCPAWDGCRAQRLRKLDAWVLPGGNRYSQRDGSCAAAGCSAAVACHPCPQKPGQPRALSAVPHTRLPRMPLQFGDTSASMWYDAQIQLNHLLGSFPFRRSLTPRNAALLRLVSFPLASMDNSLRNLCRFHRTFFFYIICLCAAGSFRRSGGEQRALRPPFAMLRSASLSSFSISIE